MCIRESCLKVERLSVCEDRSIKNSFYYLLHALIANGVPFLTLPLFTRFLLPDDYGIIGLSAAFGMFLAGVVHMGMLLAYQRNYFLYRDDPRKQGAHLYSTLCFVAVTFLICCAALLSARDFFSELVFRRSGLGNVLWLDFAACYLGVVGQYFLYFFQNRAEAKTFLRFSVLQIAVNSLSAILLVCVFKYGFVGMILGKLCAAVVLVVVLLRYFLRLLPFTFDKEILWSNIKLALPLSLRSISKPIMNNFDKWMINALASLNGAGVYVIAQHISYTGFAAMTALDQVYVPKTLEMMFDLKQEGGKTIAAYLMPFCFFSLLLCLGVSLFSEEVIRLLLPPNYHAAVELAAILALYYGLMFFGKLPHFLYSGRTALITMLSFITTAMTIVLCWWLVPRWGAMGAAVGLFVSEALVELVFFFVRQREYRIEWPYGRLMAVVLLFLAAGFAVITARIWVDHYVVLLTIKLSVLGIYLYFGRMCGFWDRQQLGSVILMVRRKFG